VNKADLIDQIAQAAEISKSAAERAVDAMIGAVKATLRKDEIVTLVGFGTFYAGKRAARTGRNPAHRRSARHQSRAHAEVPCWQALKDAIN
jgi:DNA-binding protein HU-beta